MSLSKESLGFMLAVDNCGRNCSHCPAHGLGQEMQIAPFDDLQQRLRVAHLALKGKGTIRSQTIHAWRIGDLLDYRDQSSGTERTVADLADAWVNQLGQPLYTVTNGTLGTPWRRAALSHLASEPQLSSQIKLTITPFDQKFSHKNYISNMAYDLTTLWPLVTLSSLRPESLGQPRFRVNIKTTAATREQVIDVTRCILRESDLPVDIDTILAGKSNIVKVKPVYDLRIDERQPLVPGAIALGNTIGLRLKPEEVRARYQLGFRPDGRAFSVDLWTFTETVLYSSDGTPQTFATWFTET